MTFCNIMPFRHDNKVEEAKLLSKHIYERFLYFKCLDGMFTIEVVSWKLSVLNTDFPAPLKINTEENNKCRG